MDGGIDQDEVSFGGEVTAQAVDFVTSTGYADLPEPLIAMSQRCMIDTVGLYAAGLSERSVQIIIEQALDDGGRPDTPILGTSARGPAQVAARVLGISAHAHDFDDTQVSHDPRHVYGLLTHPSAAPLSAALATAPLRPEATGADLLAAFNIGYEVSCKVSEWMLPDHYLRGHHSSGTVATFGAAAAAAWLLRLDARQTAHAFGIAAATAAGVRCNFGTMAKPLHVGRAAENGVFAALLARRGFTADPAALDGRWGFASVLAGGYRKAKLGQGFGRTWSMLEPGVSIKPYPSGIVTHQAMDMVAKLVAERDIRPEQVVAIDFHAGDNILNPIRYPVAANGLQAKFSMAALISMIVIHRRAGLPEFEDRAIEDPAFQAMQRRVTCHRADDINAKGFDIIRSRITIRMQDGTEHQASSDPRYRGGPSHPLSAADLEGKFRACAQGQSTAAQDALLAAIAGLPAAASAAPLLDALAALRL